MDDPSTQTTLNIPSLVAFAVISFFAIRYFFFSPSSPSTYSQSGYPSSLLARSRHPFPAMRVDTVASMFPQLSRRDVEWDLVLNGGSVQATSERVLREGRLPPAPPNFQPVYANPGGTPARSTPAGRTASRQQKQVYENLITRYNLASRVGAAPASGDAETGTATDGIQTSEAQKAKGGWSTNKNERQDLLKRRREEMVLAARRKLEERDRKGKEKATA